MNIPRQRSHFTFTREVLPVSEHGTVKLQTVVTKFAHGYNEPALIGNLNRTKQRIRTATALERIYETNAKLLGLIRYEEKKVAQRSAKQARRHNFKLNRNLKNI